MTMLANPTHLPNHDVILDRISDGGNGNGNMVMDWFSDMVEATRTSAAATSRATSASSPSRPARTTRR